MEPIEITAQEYNFIIVAQKLVKLLEGENKRFKSFLKSEHDLFTLVHGFTQLLKTVKYGIHQSFILELVTIAKENTLNLNTCFMLVFSTL